MKLGIGVGYLDKDCTLPVEMIQRAERLGYHAVWTAETYGADCLTPLAYLAAVTKRLKLGCGVAQLDARTPANLAMCAQTIDRLSGGDRMIVGIGASGPQIVEGWYGRPWGKPNYRIRDTVAIVRKIFKREGPVTHQGKEISLPYTGPGAIGLGKPLKSILRPSPHIPIYIGADSELNVRMTGEIADGYLGFHITPGLVPYYQGLLKEGLARRTDGRTLEDFEIQGIVGVKIADDVKTALQQPKAHIAMHVGGMGAKDKNFHKDSMVKRGYAEAAQRIQELYLAGHKEDAEAAVPDEYVDEEWLLGPPARIKERYPVWRDSGMTSLNLRRCTPEVMELMAKIAL